MKIIIVFKKTIQNQKDLLEVELYYRYLKIILIIMNFSVKKRITSNIIHNIYRINNCMINLIDHSHLINYIQKKPKTLFLKRNNTEIELNEELIKELSNNEILIYKTSEENLIFDIKKFNANVLDDLEYNLKFKIWETCNFQYINDYNFIYSNNGLKNAFKNFIKDVIESPYIKNNYNKVETRFNNNDNNYVFDNSEDIINEIFNYIQFIPLPFDDIYGFADKGSFDIYIDMYDDFVAESFDLLGKLYANSNDLVHELFHISACYYIMNSNNKDFKNFYSKVSKQRKIEYENIQKKFLEDTNDTNKKIKKEKDIDLGDSIEIECYGFCIKQFTLFNVLELFIKDNWYDNEKIKSFKENYIKRSKINEEDNKNEETQTQNMHEESKDNKEKNKMDKIITIKIENKQNIKKNDNNIEIEKDITIKDNKNNKEDEKINLNDYVSKSEILKIFFELYPTENNEKEYKNELIYIRKRESSDDDNKGIIYERPLRLSRYQIFPYGRPGFRP